MKKFFSRVVSECGGAMEFYTTLRPEKSLMLHSANERGRFSFVLFQPTWHRVGKVEIQEMKSLFKKAKQDKDLSSKKNSEIPFCGGIGCIIPYEQSSDGVVGIYDTWMVEDHATQECFLQGWFEDETEAMLFFSELEGVSWKKPKYEQVLLSKQFSPVWEPEIYLKHFANCQKELELGNSFQINLSQKFEAKSDSSAWDIFCMATKKNPGSMMAFWEEKERAMISCSPERLFSVNCRGKMLTQPIAGTRKRGKSKEEDLQLEQELKTSQKELAEHSMLVDLLRNDFGKVAKFGSVQVPSFARIEQYASVMHLVSDVVGVLSFEKNAFDVLEATFPGGTITGAPKKETMEILKREEKEARGFYCGSVCYFSYDGSADASIGIRTLEKQGKKLWGRAGGGLVWGADGNREYEETRHKFGGIEKIFSS